MKGYRSNGESLPVAIFVAGSACGSHTRGWTASALRIAFSCRSHIASHLRLGPRTSDLGPRLLLSEHHHRIHTHRAAGRNVAGDQRDEPDEQRHRGGRERIRGLDVEEL